MTTATIRGPIPLAASAEQGKPERKNKKPETVIRKLPPIPASMHSTEPKSQSFPPDTKPDLIYYIHDHITARSAEDEQNEVADLVTQHLPDAQIKFVHAGKLELVLDDIKDKKLKKPPLIILSSDQVKDFRHKGPGWIALEAQQTVQFIKDQLLESGLDESLAPAIAVHLSAYGSYAPNSPNSEYLNKEKNSRSFSIDSTNYWSDWDSNKSRLVDKNILPEEKFLEIITRYGEVISR